MSSASGTREARRACSSVMRPSASSPRTMASGAGRMKSSAVSVREILAMTRFEAMTPSGPPHPQAREPVTHQVRRQLEEGGRLHAGHAVREEEVDGGPFEAVLARAVDEVAGVAEAGDLVAEADQRLLHGFGEQSGRSVRAEEARAGHRDDEVGGGDAVGHGTAHVRLLEAVGGEEPGAAEAFGAERGRGGDHFVGAVAGERPAAWPRPVRTARARCRRVRPGASGCRRPRCRRRPGLPARPTAAGADRWSCCVSCRSYADQAWSWWISMPMPPSW